MLVTTPSRLFMGQNEGDNSTQDLKTVRNKNGTKKFWTGDHASEDAEVRQAFNKIER